MNALRIEDVNVVSFPQPAMKPALVSVNLAELNRVTFALLRAEESEKSSLSRWHVSFINTKGRLDNKTLGEFLSTGISGKIRGLNSLLNEQDATTRLDGLLYLECVYHLLKSRKVARFEEITAEMLATQRRMIEMFPETHTASQAWIASYKAKVAAAYEGKAARMDKKRQFCLAVFGAAAF